APRLDEPGGCSNALRRDEAGGKKLPELEALTMARRAIDAGAAGVGMGRNIFQSDAPIAMIQAVSAVVHEGASAADAKDLYETLRAG
ncbi:MAG: hypothetical protein ABI458_07860, partial [Chloroflexota bacterium]